MKSTRAASAATPTILDKVCMAMRRSFGFIVVGLWRYAFVGAVCLVCVPWWAGGAFCGQSYENGFIFAWFLECYVTYILILGFGEHFGISIAFFVISFIALSMVIPSSSVFVGPYQFAYILALNIYHIPKSQALGIAFIHQLTIMLLITLISIIYFLKDNTSILEIQTEIEKGEEGKLNT